MPGYGFMGGIHKLQRRRLRQEAEGRLPPALRLHRRLLRPRRDDPQQGQLLRDRPERGGQLGHPRAALPLEVVGPRAQPGAAHAARPAAQIIEAMGGKVAGHAARAATRTTASSAGGEIIHEAGTTRMGTSPRTSVLNEWCQAHDCKNLFVADSGPVRQQRAQEHDLDDPGPVHAHERAHRRGAQEGEPLMSRRLGRRDAPASSSAPRPLAVGFGAGAAEAPRPREHGGHGRRRPRPRARPTRRSSSPPTNGRRCACWWTSSSRKDERSGSATDAGVPEFMDFLMIDPPDDRARSARTARPRCAAAWPGSTPSAERRFGHDFVDCDGGRAHGAARRDRLQGREEDRGEPELHTARAPSFFNSLPRPHRLRLLEQQDGHRGPRLHGQHASWREWKGPPPEVKALGWVAWRAESSARPGTAQPDDVPGVRHLGLVAAAARALPLAASCTSPAPRSAGSSPPRPSRRSRRVFVSGQLADRYLSDRALPGRQPPGGRAGHVRARLPEDVLAVLRRSCWSTCWSTCRRSRSPTRSASTT